MADSWRNSALLFAIPISPLSDQKACFCGQDQENMPKQFFCFNTCSQVLVLGLSSKKESCNFVLKRDHEVYAVKMFPLLRHLSALLFNRNREYTVRHFVIFFSKFSSVCFHFDRRPKKLCNYWKDISGENQAIRKILLIHPCGIDVYGAERLGGIEVLAAQQFLSELRRKK